MKPDEQLAEWVKGNSIHNAERNAIWTSECLQQIVDFLKKQEGIK